MAKYKNQNSKNNTPEGANTEGVRLIEVDRDAIAKVNVVGIRRTALRRRPIVGGGELVLTILMSQLKFLQRRNVPLGRNKTLRFKTFKNF